MTRNQQIALLAVALAGGLSVTCLGLGGLLLMWNWRAAEQPRNAVERAGAVGPVTDVGDGSKVLAVFRDDPIGAPRRWVGKRVRLTAAVTQVDPNEGEPYLQLAGGRFLVVPAAAERGAFGRLTAGTVVTVEGTVDTPTTGVPPLTLSGAALVPPGP